MERISYNSLRLSEFMDNLSPKKSGIFFSILFHLTILLFSFGLPNFFGQKNIYIPNVIPIEILNIADTTNTQKSENKENLNKNAPSIQKKFNSSENAEIQKNFEISQNNKTIQNNLSVLDIKEKTNAQIKEKKVVKIKEKVKIELDQKFDTMKTNDIKPKLKPKPKKPETPIKNSDIEIEPKIKKELITDKSKNITKPKPKPKEDFSMASMLKDLRNEQSNNVIEEDNADEEKEQTGEEKQNTNMVLSISEIDLLRQQLSSCWNAPAGAVINIGDKVTISAKVRQNMKVFENSVRIVDTNISKSNPFYGPITDSAMRTLLNPECTPLKLPQDKYDLWKSLTITFDYSIMKGY